MLAPIIINILFVLLADFITPIDCIYGGGEVPIFKFPNQVYLYVNGSICGGIIYNVNVIITAGHCASHIKVDDFLYAGVGHKNKNKGKKHYVTGIVVHNEYNSQDQNLDVALLKLDHPIKYNFEARPLPLLKPDEEPNLEGKEAWVSGWGRTEEGYPDNLRAVQVRIIHNEDCTGRFIKVPTPSSTGTTYINYSISENMLCAHTKYKDSCVGDSGGPLVYKGKVVGIVSWGIICGDVYYPGVYVRVSAVYDWIVKHAEELTGSHPIKHDAL